MASAAPPSAPEAAAPSAAPVTTAALAPAARRRTSCSCHVPMTRRAPRWPWPIPAIPSSASRPSSAPPLNAGLSQWSIAAPPGPLPQEPLAEAGSADMGRELRSPRFPPFSGSRYARGGMGGPAMSGDVVANLDAVQVAPIGRAAHMDSGVPPTEIIYFPRRHHQPVQVGDEPGSQRGRGFPRPRAVRVPSRWWAMPPAAPPTCRSSGIWK